MAQVRVNIDRVKTASTVIKSINNTIRRDFSQTQQAVTQLHRVWSGAAADNSAKKFRYINSSLQDARYNLVDSFTRFLDRQVGENYAKTESSLDALAAQFK